MQKPAFLANLTRAMGPNFLNAKRYWNTGMMEYWNDESEEAACFSHYSIFASFTSVLSVISVAKKGFLLKDYRKPGGVSIQPAILRTLYPQ